MLPVYHQNSKKNTSEVVNVNLFLPVAYGPESAPFLVMNFVVPARGGGIHPSTSTINYIPYNLHASPATTHTEGKRFAKKRRFSARKETCHDFLL